MFDNEPNGPWRTIALMGLAAFLAILLLWQMLTPVNAATVNLMDGKPLQCTPIEKIRLLARGGGNLVRVTDRFVIMHVPAGMLVGVRVGDWACMPRLVPVKGAGA